MPVAQINALASKFRLPYAAGDELVVRLVKEGREHGQGVGYLDDGTMVVVEDAAALIGGQVEVRVRNVIADDDRPDDLREPRNGSFRLTRAPSRTVLRVPTASAMLRR